MCEALGLVEDAKTACSVLERPPFSGCEGLDVTGYMATCMEDYCNCAGDDACTCPSLKEAAEICGGDVPACK